MTLKCTAFLLFVVLCSECLEAQSLPSLPSFPIIESSLDEAYNFPAKEYHVKELRSYDGQRSRYIAQYDSQGRIVKLEDYSHDSLRPNVTQWTYSDSSTVAKTTVPPCKTCSKPTTITERRMIIKGYVVKMHIVRTSFNQGLARDSVYIRKRKDGALCDSAVFRNGTLMYSFISTFHPNGISKHVAIKDNTADIDYLVEDITIEYDTAGNKLKQVILKGGKLMVERLYGYNERGNWVWFKESGEEGLVYYAEQMEYNQNGLPLRHITRDSSYGYLRISEEEWRYDEHGRYVWHSQTRSESYFYRRYFDDSGNNYVELKRSSEVLTRSVVTTEGRIRTTTTSVHKNKGALLPKPGIQTESDSLFRVERIEVIDTLFQVPIKKTNYERDPKKPHTKTSEYTYEYDEKGRMVKETAWSKNREEEKTLVSTFQYNERGQSTRVVRVWSTGDTLVHVTRRYSEQGNLLLLDSCRGMRFSRDSFAYDSLHRVVFSMHKSMGGDTRTVRYSYACDGLWEKRETIDTEYVFLERAEYLPSCLPARYTVTRQWGTAQDVKWEYEYLR